MTNPFCSRKGGATIKGKFHPLQPVSLRREIALFRKIAKAKRNGPRNG